MNEEATIKEKFDVLFTKLKSYHDSALDSTFKVVGLLLLMIGWAVTSDSARNVLKNDSFVRRGAIVAILLGAIVYVVTALHVYYMSKKKILNSLDHLGYMPKEYYSDFHPRLFIVVYLVFHETTKVVNSLRVSTTGIRR